METTVNEFEDLLDSKSYNLKNIYRYSNCHFINQESTAEHTILMSMLAIHIYNKLTDPGFDLKDLLYKITIHDLDECVLCDIPRDIKYYNEDSYKLINKVANELLNKSGFKKSFIEEVLNAKSDDVEGELVSMLDVIQAIIKLYQEYKLQGTTSMRERLYTSVGYLKERVESYVHYKQHDELRIYLQQLLRDIIEVVKGIENGK